MNQYMKEQDEIDYSRGYPPPFPNTQYNRDSQELVDRMKEDIDSNLRNGSTQPPLFATKLEAIRSNLAEWEKLVDEYWNEHDGTHFYKDELKDLIRNIVKEEKLKSYAQGQSDMIGYIAPSDGKRIN